jgi:hypothetical protein
MICLIADGIFSTFAAGSGFMVSTGFWPLASGRIGHLSSSSFFLHQDLSHVLFDGAVPIGNPQGVTQNVRARYHTALGVVLAHGSHQPIHNLLVLRGYLQGYRFHQVNCGGGS